MFLASKAAWAEIVFRLLTSGDLPTTPDSARFGSERKQKRAIKHFKDKRAEPRM